MILIIRGHIRNTFDTKDFYNLIKNIYHNYPDLKIFIHTWNIISNGISWRDISTNIYIVTEEYIYDYFNDLNHLIKHIIIDDDTKINLIGNLEGKISNCNMPIIGWKNYWYGKYKIIEYINNLNIDIKETIINSRFDILNNSNSLKHEIIINFINNNDTEFNKNIFIYNCEKYGLDNLYLGNINTMYKLIYHLHYKLDNILLNKINETEHQEYIVYRLNNILFN